MLLRPLRDIDDYRRKAGARRGLDQGWFVRTNRLSLVVAQFKFRTVDRQVVASIVRNHDLVRAEGPSCSLRILTAWRLCAESSATVPRLHLKGGPFEPRKRVCD